MARTRAIRFSDLEEQQIEQFLHENSFLDFSTLARLAIIDFMKNPKITLRPVMGKVNAKKKRDVMHESTSETPI